MKEENKTKKVTVKCKVDSDLILDLYEKAKLLKGKKKKELMEQIHFLAENMGKWLVK